MIKIHQLPTYSTPNTFSKSAFDKMQGKSDNLFLKIRNSNVLCATSGLYVVYKSLMPPPSRDGVRRMWTTRTLRPRPGPVG